MESDIKIKHTVGFKDNHSFNEFYTLQDFTNEFIKQVEFYANNPKIDVVSISISDSISQGGFSKNAYIAYREK